MTTVTKEDYKAWEANVLSIFGPSSPLPPEGRRMVKQKVIVFAYRSRDLKGAMREHNPSSEESMKTSMKTSMKRRGVRSARSYRSTTKRKLSLWHMGSKRMETVSYGWDEEKGRFLFPGTDVGGLTNAVHTPPSPFLFSPVPPCALKDGRLYSLWKRASGKDSFVGGSSIRLHLDRWVESVLREEGRFKFGFWRGEEEERVILDARVVKERTGTYLVRLFGEDTKEKGEEYARAATEEEIDSLSCGVGERYITPNLNRANIENEYV